LVRLNPHAGGDRDAWADHAAQKRRDGNPTCLAVDVPDGQLDPRLEPRFERTLDVEQEDRPKIASDEPAARGQFHPPRAEVGRKFTLCSPHPTSPSSVSTRTIPLCVVELLRTCDR